MAAGCAFDLAHYVELLDAAKAGGYRWAAFNREPRPGDLLLRPAREEYQRRALPSLAHETRVVAASLGNDAGVLGAAALVL